MEASVAPLARAASSTRPLLGVAACGGRAALAAARDGVTLYDVVGQVRRMAVKECVCGRERASRRPSAGPNQN